jgi:hypothetical protein
MASAYCAGGAGALHINGTIGASCDGAKAVIVCVRQ